MKQSNYKESKKNEVVSNVKKTLSGELDTLDGLRFLSENIEFTSLGENEVVLLKYILSELDDIPAQSERELWDEFIFEKKRKDAKHFLTECEKDVNQILNSAIKLL